MSYDDEISTLVVDPGSRLEDLQMYVSFWLISICIIN